MAEFRCRVGTPQGMIAERYVRAASAGAAREQLAAEGVEIFDIGQRSGGALSALRKLATMRIGAGRQKAAGGGLLRRRTKVSASDLLLLNQELVALVRAGLPLLRCVDILRTRRAGTVAGSVLDRVRRQVASGQSLSGAFRPEVQQAGIPELFVTSLEVGEASGDLVTAIRRYSEHLQQSQVLRQRVRSALVYPMVLLGVALIVVTILLTMVIPRFADFYASSGAQLPLLTRVLMGVADAFTHYGLFAAGAVAVAAVAFGRFSRTESGRARVDEWSLRVPLLGPLRRRYFGLESTRTLATLLRGGAPLVRALQVTARGTSNVAYRQRLLQVAEQVSEGTSLHKSFEARGLLDPLGLELVEVGESTGSLEEMLEHVAITYDEVLDRQVTFAVGLMEPAMLVFMGLLVAGILLSLYMPLFQAVQVIG